MRLLPKLKMILECFRGMLMRDVAYCHEKRQSGLCGRIQCETLSSRPRKESISMDEISRNSRSLKRRDSEKYMIISL